MPINKYIFLILLFLIGITNSTASVPNIQLDKNIKNTKLSSRLLGYYKDSSKNISFDSFYQNTSLFAPIKGNTIFSASPDDLWLAFRLTKNKEDSFRNFILQLGNAHISNYEIYFSDSKGLIYKKAQGDNFVFSQREVRHNFFVHNLPDISGDMLDIFIKIDNEGLEVDLPINIFERNHFIQHTLNVKIFHGLIIGLFLITSIVTLFLYFIYRERYFIYEVIVSIASILYILSEEGYGLMLLWPNSTYINAISRPVFVSLVVIFSLLFTLDFLKIFERKPSHYYISIASIIGYVIFMVAFHPIDLCQIRTGQNIGAITSFYLFLTMLICLLIILIALKEWIKNKSTDGMVLFCVFTVTMISVGVRILSTLGLSPSTELVQHTGFITRGIHIPLICGYLVYTAIKNFKENQQVKVELLETRNKMTQAVIEKIDTERQRISMALHDSAGSIITGLKANLQMISEDFDNIKNDQHYEQSLHLSNQLQQEIRNISNDLLPSSILKIGLLAEVKNILHNIEETYNIVTSIESNTDANQEIDSKIVFHLYYIIREALDNIVKYAKAKSILVQYFKYEDELHLLIEDDGQGFDITEARAKGGNGLNNLALRVAWLKGTIDLYSDNGTSISINIPITT